MYSINVDAQSIADPGCTCKGKTTENHGTTFDHEDWEGEEAAKIQD
jgi:hypothetical protein